MYAQVVLVVFTVLCCVLTLCWLFALYCISGCVVFCTVLYFGSGYVGCFVLFALCCIVWCSGCVRCMHCVVLGTKVMLVITIQHNANNQHNLSTTQYNTVQTKQNNQHNLSTQYTTVQSKQCNQHNLSTQYNTVETTNTT